MGSFVISPLLSVVSDSLASLPILATASALLISFAVSSFLSRDFSL
ncbi:MAG: hypothetical protein P8Y46_05825 [Sulfurovaceae bacterium]